MTIHLDIETLHMIYNIQISETVADFNYGPEPAIELDTGDTTATIFVDGTISMLDLNRNVRMISVVSEEDGETEMMVEVSEECLADLDTMLTRSTGEAKIIDILKHAVDSDTPTDYPIDEDTTAIVYYTDYPRANLVFKRFA